MSNLISRSVVIKYLKEQYVRIIMEKNDENNSTPHVALQSMESLTEAFMNFIAQMPDAVWNPPMTAKEAWEIAKKITEMEEIDIKEHILEGDAMHPIKAVFCNLTPQEAKARIKAWEARDFAVGDIIRHVDNPDLVAVITKKYEDDSYAAVSQEGDLCTILDERNWEKVGRNINIQDLLEQIGGGK